MRTLILIAATLMLLVLSLFAETVTLEWDANPEPDVAGYQLSYGVESGVYTQTLATDTTTVTTVTTVTTPDLPPGTYYFAVRAVAKSGLLSNLSNEVVHTVEPAPEQPPLPPPAKPTGLKVLPVLRSTSLTTWELDGYYVPLPSADGSYPVAEFYKFAPPIDATLGTTTSPNP